MIKKYKGFKGKEQSLINFIYIQNPNLIDIVITNSENDYNKWFYLHYYFSICKIYNEIPIKDFPIIYISPDHNEKYNNRKIKLEETLKHIGCKNISHFKSGTEKYPQCLLNATINILENNMNGKPFILLEDDVAWTGVENIDIPEDADAVYLGLTFCGGNLFHNCYLPGISCEAKPYTKSICKINNMLTTHAILYISERYKKAVVNELHKIGDRVYNSDVIISRLHRFFKIYSVNTPVFYQDDIYTKATTKLKFVFNEKNELGIYNF